MIETLLFSVFSNGLCTVKLPVCLQTSRIQSVAAIYVMMMMGNISNYTITGLRAHPCEAIIL